jgi:hypothetical protein
VLWTWQSASGRAKWLAFPLNGTPDVRRFDPNPLINVRQGSAAKKIPATSSEKIHHLSVREPD